MRSATPFVLGVMGLMLVPSRAGAQAEHRVSFEIKQCNEDVIGLRVDPDPIQDMVGPEFSLSLDEGMARVAIMVQDCSQYWIDGEDLGPNQHVHILARIEGPADVRPVVGAEQTEPTMTWFSLFAGSTNPRGRAARMASRTAPEPIESVSLDPPGAPRGGEVTLGPDLHFSWTVPEAAPSTRLMGVNHDIYLRHDGDIVYKRIQAVANLVAAPSPGALELAGTSELAEVIGAGRHPALVYTLFPVWARGDLGLEPTR